MTNEGWQIIHNTIGKDILTIVMDCISNKASCSETMDMIAKGYEAAYSLGRKEGEEEKRRNCFNCIFHKCTSVHCPKEAP